MILIAAITWYLDRRRWKHSTSTNAAVHGACTWDETPAPAPRPPVDIRPAVLRANKPSLDDMFRTAIGTDRVELEAAARRIVPVYVTADGGDR